ncbi:MAG: hypothetical protein BRC25_02000 [Parcubacteria group bacterium SW_6_46_9]|nr:MAG: hypothetical protein BRC25_02000 [Parcubacteria group bacterium SW_6_46_9]
MANSEQIIDAVIQKALDRNASDIHLSTDRRPIIRIADKLSPIQDQSQLSARLSTKYFLMMK